MYIYFLSTGRCGTSFIYNILSKNCADVNISHQSNWSRLLNISGNLPINDKLLSPIYSTLKGHNKPQNTVDPLLSIPIVKIIRYKKLNQNKYKIVHLVRDPRTFVTSFMNWKNSSIRKLILHHFIPFWQPSPRFDKNLPVKDRLVFNKFKQFCYVWHYKNSLFYNEFAEYDNYLLIRLEDLTNPLLCNEKITELFNFLNLPVTNEIDFKQWLKKKVNRSPKKTFPDYKNWSDDQKRYLEKMCGPLMREFGYR